MVTIRFRLLLLVAALSLGLPAGAQLHRGARTVVRGGLLEKPDSLKGRRDSLRLAGLVRQIDSIAAAEYAADSAAVADLRSDDLHYLDSLALARFDAAQRGVDTTTKRKVYKKGWFMSDSMSLSKVCWISTVVPGYGQIYNKQYWKLPILYGLVGTGLGLYIHENKTYKPLKRQFESYTDVNLSRTPELDALQSKMIRSNTRRQVYLGITIASYIYFIGDAAVSYSTNDVSSVKKATTLACIFPGAGQIYNKSYWKVPIVLGGIATMGYVINFNNRGLERFKLAYDLVTDGDPNTIDEFNGRYTADYLKKLRDNYRRNRDLCIIITAGLYLLNIIDAHVDAHMKEYDISDDLSMNLEPTMVNMYTMRSGTVNGVGFAFKLAF